MLIEHFNVILVFCVVIFEPAASLFLILGLENMIHKLKFVNKQIKYSRLFKNSNNKVKITIRSDCFKVFISPTCVLLPTQIQILI